MIARALIALTLLAAGYWLWHADRERYAAAKVAVLAGQVRAEADRVAAEREQLGQARDEAAAKGTFNYLERAKAQEHQHDQERDYVAGLERRVVRLRGDLSASGGAIRPDPGGACTAEYRQYSERVEGLLREGRDLGVAGAELAVAARGLAGEGAGRLAASASLIELARDWAQAVKLGEAKPP